MCTSQHLLQQTLRDIHFHNPVTMLSGNAGYGVEYEQLRGFDYSMAGAVFLKGTTSEPKVGNPPERVLETPSGMMNAIGLQNPGVQSVIHDYLPKLDMAKTRFIANVCGSSIEEYYEICRRFDDTALPALEINISCPNVKRGGATFGNDPQMSAKVVEQCRRATKKVLIVKLSPNQTDIGLGARAVIDAGADMISAINTLSALHVNIHTRKPGLGNGTGGLSGPAIKPIALLKVHQVYQEAKQHNVPIIGQGGIFTWQDAIEFLLAGANLVGVGTALAKDPFVVSGIVKGIEGYLRQHGITHISELVGQLEC